MLPLIATGLSLLPKLPELWGGIAGLFGKEVPESVEAAGKLAGEIAGALSEGKVPVEQQIRLKAMFYAHEEKIRELELKEKELDYRHVQHESEQFVKLWTSDTASTDKFVARTRPKILRGLFTTCKLYIFYGPLAIVAGKSVGLEASTLNLLIELILWFGGYIFGAFTLGFGGYTAARTIDKRIPGLKQGDDMKAKLMRAALGGIAGRA